MLRFVQTTPIGGDCTCGYDVILDKEYSVGELVNTILTNSNEWGYIGIRCEGRVFGYPNCEFKHGKITSDELPQVVLDQKVGSVDASGGWSRMDYLITVKFEDTVK